MNISVIIVSYNTKHLLKKCLDSVVVQNQDNTVEIIVVDNASVDGTNEMVINDFPKVKLIQNKTNVGFGTANNQGAKIANGEYLFLLNSDTILQKNALQEIGIILTNSNYGAIGFKILNDDLSLQPSSGCFPTLLNLFMETFFLDRILKLNRFYHILNKNKYQKKFNPDWVSGSCFIVSKEIFNKVSGFDDKYFLYVEEVDLCYRIKKNGYKNIYFPINAVVHSNRASTKSKQTAIVFTHHNLIYFFRKHYNLLQTGIVYILFILKSIVYSVLGLVLGIIFKNQKQKANSYLFLLLTLLSKAQFKKYENSFKQ